MAVAKKPEPKKPAAKPAPAKAPAKPAAKPAPAKKEVKPAAKAPTKAAQPAKAPAKADPKKTYHVVKRKEDNMWEVKLAKVGDAQGKAIKLFKTKDEATAYVAKMAENQGANVAVHASKGKNKGKIQK
ncbi:DUF2188 domain-containing protein [bacterium]|nr:DUF2188 domain-containing protein [bacterium]